MQDIAYGIDRTSRKLQLQCLEEKLCYPIFLTKIHKEVPDSTDCLSRSKANIASHAQLRVCDEISSLSVLASFPTVSGTKL